MEEELECSAWFFRPKPIDKETVLNMVLKK